MGQSKKKKINSGYLTFQGKMSRGIKLLELSKRNYQNPGGSRKSFRETYYGTVDSSPAPSLPSDFPEDLIDGSSISSWQSQSSLSSAISLQIQKPEIDFKDDETVMLQNPVGPAPTDDETVMLHRPVEPAPTDDKTVMLHRPVEPAPTDDETIMLHNLVGPAPTDDETVMLHSPVEPAPADDETVMLHRPIEPAPTDGETVMLHLLVEPAPTDDETVMLRRPVEPAPTDDETVMLHRPVEPAPTDNETIMLHNPVGPAPTDGETVILHLLVEPAPTDDETVMLHSPVEPAPTDDETVMLHSPVEPAPTDDETVMFHTPVVPSPTYDESFKHCTPVLPAPTYDETVMFHTPVVPSPTYDESFKYCTPVVPASAEDETVMFRTPVVPAPTVNESFKLRTSVVPAPTYDECFKLHTPVVFAPTESEFFMPSTPIVPMSTDCKTSLPCSTVINLKSSPTMESYISETDYNHITIKKEDPSHSDYSPTELMYLNPSSFALLPQPVDNKNKPYVGNENKSSSHLDIILPPPLKFQDNDKNESEIPPSNLQQSSFLTIHSPFTNLENSGSPSISKRKSEEQVTTTKRTFCSRNQLFNIEFNENSNASETVYSTNDIEDELYVPSPYSSCKSTPIKEQRNGTQSSEEKLIIDNQSEQPGPKVQMKYTHKFKCKKNCCPYCMTFQANLNRHMIRKHKNETKVIELMSLPKNSNSRKKIHDQLRLLGNFKHNSYVLKMGSGEIIPAVRSSKTNRSPNDYIPCRNCFGFFSKFQLWRHNKTCRKKNKDHLSGRRVIGHGLNLLCTNSISSSFKENILGSMIADDINLTVRNDRLILKFGERLYFQHPEISRRNYIRNRIRELARFLHEIRKLDSEISSLMDVMNPRKFTVVVEATKQLSGFDGTSQFQKGSLVTKVGTHLKKCAEIVSGMGLDEGNELVVNNAEFFIKRIDREWSTCLSSLALRDISTKKFNKPRYLPLLKDIQCLNKFIEDETTFTYQKLNQLKTEAVIDGKESDILKPTWHYLAKLTQSSIILFNKKRSGEASRITLENYRNGLKAKLSCPDLHNATFKNALTKYFQRIEIMGKKGRKVPVIFSKMNIKCINLLIELRSIVGVSEKNAYLLPKPNNGSLHPVNGCNSLKEIAHAAQLQKPELMLSTNLRKHIATMSQVLNLSQSELEELCKFMGHDVRVHAEFYRLPDDAVQLGKITKLLLAVQNGQVLNYRNMNLSDITVSEEDLVPDFEGCGSDSDHGENNDDDDEEEEEEEEEEEKNDSVNAGDARKHIRSPHSNGSESYFSDTSSDSADEQDIKERVPKKSGQSGVRRTWTSEERNVTIKYFSFHIRKQNLPGKDECNTFLRKNPKIKRNWTQVKNFIRNNITAINRAALKY